MSESTVKLSRKNKHFTIVKMTATHMLEMFYVKVMHQSFIPRLQ